MVHFLEAKVLGCSVSCLPLGVVVISVMFVYALKWILDNIGRAKVSWQVHVFLETPDVQYD